MFHGFSIRWSACIRHSTFSFTSSPSRFSINWPLPVSSSNVHHHCNQYIHLIKILIFYSRFKQNQKLPKAVLCKRWIISSKSFTFYSTTLSIIPTRTKNMKMYSQPTSTKTFFLTLLSTTSFFFFFITTITTPAMASALPQSSSSTKSTTTEQKWNLFHGPNPNAAPGSFPSSAFNDPSLQSYDYSQIIEERGIPADLWNLIDDSLDEIEDVPEDLAFEGCLLHEVMNFHSFSLYFNF